MLLQIIRADRKPKDWVFTDINATLTFHRGKDSWLTIVKRRKILKTVALHIVLNKQEKKRKSEKIKS